MFTDTEKALLANPGGFPLVRAAAEAARRAACPTCGRRSPVNIHGMLRLAVNKYRTDKRFRDHCAGLFKLPASVAGVMVI